MPAFISHKASDIGIYSAVCLAFDGATVPHWDPGKMSRGESLAEQLRDAIRTCEVCVFIATSRSVTSSWCLAELGAFWGAGKKVLLFIAEPDLSDSVLPPQFAGDVKVTTAQELIEETKKAINNYTAKSKDIEPVEMPAFFETPQEFAKTNDWQELLNAANTNFDIMGFSLAAWRKTRDFHETILEKAARGCKIRILLMDENNEALTAMLNNKADHDYLVGEIRENYNDYMELANVNSNVQVRKIVTSLPHFFLTKTDQCAVITQYLVSQRWGSGPTWRCRSHSKLFHAAGREFDHIWSKCTRA
jgi:hypothetical protein